MFDTKAFDPANPDSVIKAQKALMSVDPKTGKSLTGTGYGVVVNPLDGTVWRSMPGMRRDGWGTGNRFNKFDPKTGKFTNYPVPKPGAYPRQIDASSDGMIWSDLMSGHLGRFDPKTETW